MKKVLLSILLVGVATLANAQKSEIAEAEKSWNLFQVSLSMKGTATTSAPTGTDVVTPPTSGRPATGGRGRGGAATPAQVAASMPGASTTSTSSKPKPSSALERQLNTLNEGLAHADKAVLNEKTKENAKAWMYKALFSSAIAVVDTVDTQNSVTHQKNAETALAKAKSLDTKKEEKENIETAEINIMNAARGRAIRAFKAKDYNTALNIFNELIAINPNDTSMYINAGVTARLSEKYPEAIKNYKKVISLNAPESKDLYVEIINITLDKLKDTTAGFSVIKEALAKFPDDAGFIGSETDLYIATGDITKSQESLAKLIAKDSKNSVYQYLMGDTYYKQALAVQETRKKLDTKKVKEYDALGIKMTALIDQSLPFYKKANELNPTYRPALETLKQIYAFKNDNVNYADVKKKLDALPEAN